MIGPLPHVGGKLISFPIGDPACTSPTWPSTPPPCHCPQLVAVVMELEHPYFLISTFETLSFTP